MRGDWYTNMDPDTKECLQQLKAEQDEKSWRKVWLQDWEGIKENDVRRACLALSDKDVLTGCTSYIQRKLEISYCTAKAIMEEIVRLGNMSEPDDRGARRWLR